MLEKLQAPDSSNVLIWPTPGEGVLLCYEVEGLVPKFVSEISEILYKFLPFVVPDLPTFFFLFGDLASNFASKHGISIRCKPHPTPDLLKWKYPLGSLQILYVCTCKTCLEFVQDTANTYKRQQKFLYGYKKMLSS